MPKNNNAASRLHALLQQARGAQYNDDHAVSETWARLFDIQETRQVAKLLRVTESLGAMHDEVDHLSDQMALREFSEGLYRHQFDSLLQNVISPSHLGAPWRNVKVNINGEMLLALNFVSEVLPDEEDEIDPQEITQLLADLDALQESLKSSKLPGSVRTLIQRQIDLIRGALSRYKVAGAKALVEAADHALVDVLRHRDEIAPYKDTPEVGRLGKIIKKTGEVAEGAIKIHSLVEVGEKLMQIAEKLFGGG